MPYLKVIKYLVTISWVLAGHETPASETEDFIAHSAAAVMSMSMSAPLVPFPSPNPSVKWGGLHTCCGYGDFVLGLRSTEGDICLHFVSRPSAALTLRTSPGLGGHRGE